MNYEKSLAILFYGVVFVILISFIFSLIFLLSTNSIRASPKRLQQQTVDFDEDEKEECNDTINCRRTRGILSWYLC